MKTKRIATVYAISAAALYAINIPMSKLLFNHAGATIMAAFLYLGAGIGLLLYGRFEKIINPGKKQEHLTKKELPYTAAMVVLDIIAPILLMFGIARTNSMQDPIKLSFYGCGFKDLVVYLSYPKSTQEVFRLCLLFWQVVFR